MSSEEKLLTPVQVAKMLACSYAKVRYMAVQGKLPGMKIGQAWRFRLSDINDYLDHAVGQGGAA